MRDNIYCPKCCGLDCICAKPEPPVCHVCIDPYDERPCPIHAKPEAPELSPFEDQLLDTLIAAHQSEAPTASSYRPGESVIASSHREAPRASERCCENGLWGHVHECMKQPGAPSAREWWIDLRNAHTGSDCHSAWDFIPSDEQHLYRRVIEHAAYERLEKERNQLVIALVEMTARVKELEGEK